MSLWGLIIILLVWLFAAWATHIAVFDNEAQTFERPLRLCSCQWSSDGIVRLQPAADIGVAKVRTAAKAAVTAHLVKITDFSTADIQVFSNDFRQSTHPCALVPFQQRVRALW